MLPLGGRVTEATMDQLGLREIRKCVAAAVLSLMVHAVLYGGCLDPIIII